MSHAISLAFLTVFDIGPVEAVRVAAAAGYDMLGVRLLPAATSGEQDYPLLTDDALLADMKTALSDHGIRVGDVEIIRLKPENDWPLIERFCARCEALDARHILVAGDDPDTGRLTANFARLCEIAARHGQTADLEFMPWTAVPDLASAAAIVAASGQPNGGVLIDALHLDRSSSSTAEVAGLPPARMNYVQFCDGPVPYDPSDEGLIRVARGERLMPGLGGVDVTGLARAIPQDVTISVEVPHRALASKVDARARAEMAMAATRGILRGIGRL
ncbi:sugar phosphate isomerase/epimerase family protein [Haematobacter genomosp. 1]|uniref:Xylose isomerase-like TIM barrel domain-containing protein n=1 Tax=Haematobacter genomosp. 1 TaxID=366618 RepID=A0A212ADX6_9RHOB|nr:TIM barrel protein [Haematobacter genomosp. 1]OWJ79379.1 hypothetical protein CDV49_05730 [Haematobacter genomosp. 1]